MSKKNKRSTQKPVQPAPVVDRADWSRLTDIESNRFATVLYEKPICQRGSSLFKRIITWFKRRDYESNTVKPIIKKLRNTAPSFLDMCDFADFIKILEKVFFYRNAATAWKEDKNPETRILADNKIDSNDMKCIILEMQKEQVTIILTMHRMYNSDTKSYDDIIDVKMNYDFGKKLLIKFQIINSSIDFESVHDYNLMYNINLILQDAMADLFEKYYKIV